MYQTSDASAGMCACNHMHQIRKTDAAAKNIITVETYAKISN